MPRLVWVFAFLATFVAGLAVGGAVKGRLPGLDDGDTVRQLKEQITTLQARLRARETLATSPPAGSTAGGPTPAGSSSPAPGGGRYFAGFAEDRVIGRGGPIGPASTNAAT